MTFIDVPNGLEHKKKESFTNELEAEALLDYYVNFIQKSDEFLEKQKGIKQSLFIVSPFRTQAHTIR